MSDSIFDTAALLDSVTTEAATRRSPIPAGTELLGVIEDVGARQWQSPAKGTSGMALDLKVRVDTSSVKDQPPSILINDGFIVDLTASGTMDWAVGKNNALRRYREATGTNVAGQPFSVRGLIGRQVKVTIGNREYQGEIFDEIKSVSKA